MRDMDDLKNNLTEAQEKNTALETELTETQKSLEETKAERDKLKEEADGFRAEVEYVDSNVVFVMNGSDDKRYHKYACAHFTNKKNILAYTVKQAETNGYTPCPDCIGTN